MFRIFCAVALLLGLLISPVLAAFEDESSAYQTVLTVAPLPPLVVPTVIELDLSRMSISEANFMVYEIETGEWVTPQYRDRSDVRATTPIITQLGVNRQVGTLTDQRPETTYTFTASSDNVATTILRFVYPRPITSSALILDLSQNVTLPEMVEILYGDELDPQTALARTRVGSENIMFPEVISAQWQVTFVHNQPLRLSELTFKDVRADVAITRSLRFLAQPLQSYKVYANPDRPSTIDGRESGNVWDSSGVTVKGKIASNLPNAYYLPSDKDGDGIENQADNCPDITNLDQVDIDGSNIGDACEDFDRDGIYNNLDNCINLPNPNQRDEDADGIGDACDDEESRLTEQYAWIPWVALGVAVATIGSMFFLVYRRPLAVADSTTDLPTGGV